MMSLHLHTHHLGAPLAELVEERISRLNRASYHGDELTRAHPELLQEVYDPLSEEAMSLTETLDALERDGTVEGFHPHDPVLRLAPTGRRVALSRRLLRRHHARLRAVAKRLDVREDWLKHLSRLSLNPRLPTALWAELILMEMSAEFASIKLDGEAILEEHRPRLMSEPAMLDDLERWTQDRLTSMMQSIHKWWCHHPYFLRVIERFHDHDLVLFEQPEALYQRAEASQGPTDDDEVLRRRIIGAYCLLADHQRHEMKWHMIAEHRRRLLNSLRHEQRRWSVAQEVISGLFDEQDEATVGSLCQLAQRDHTLLDQLTALAHKEENHLNLLDWIGRIELPELSVEEEMEQELREGLNRQQRKREAQHAALTGVGQGDELARLLPSELGLLSGDEEGDELLEALFYQRFTEKRLSLYQSDDLDQALFESPAPRLQSKLKPRGPYIMCVDSSYSMMGIQELQAKALAVQLARRAAREGRSCYLIQFSIDTISVDLGTGSGLKSLINFLSESFRTGTDLNPALRQAHLLLSDEGGDYEGADVLVISDFELPALKEQLKAEVSQNQREGVGYYAVLVGRKSTQDPFFESCDQRFQLSLNGELSRYE